MMHYGEQFGRIFFRCYSLRHVFTNTRRFSFYCLQDGKVRAPHSKVKMEMLIFFFSLLGVTLWPPGSSFKNSASACLVPLLSQIQFPSWLSGTEISLLYSRAVHLCERCFYISHYGICQVSCWCFHKVFTLGS